MSPTTGILSIALPYTGVFAKVFSEMIDEADLSAVRVLPSGTGALSAFVYARLPELAVPFKTYTLYRLECGLRSTLVLGFIGLPTMGFHLESAFRQGRYAEAAGLLLAFYVLIGTRRLWARPSTIPILLIGSLLVLPATVGGGSVGANLVRFLAGIIPAPLRGADLAAEATWLNVGAWLKAIATKQIVPGAIQTLVLSQITLVATAIGALVLFPLVCRRFVGRLGQPLGPIILVVVRSPPEYMLASVLLKIRGPSMLPAILALTIHNAGIIGYLMGRHADTLDYRPDAPTGVNLYFYETVADLVPPVAGETTGAIISSGGERPSGFWWARPRYETWPTGCCGLESGDAKAIPVRKLILSRSPAPPPWPRGGACHDATEALPPGAGHCPGPSPCGRY